MCFLACEAFNLNVRAFLTCFRMVGALRIFWSNFSVEAFSFSFLYFLLDIFIVSMHSPSINKQINLFFLPWVTNSVPICANNFVCLCACRVDTGSIRWGAIPLGMIFA